MVDPSAPLDERHAEVVAHLEQLGLTRDQALGLATQALLPDLVPLVQNALSDERTASGRLITDASHDTALEQVNAELGVDRSDDPSMTPVGMVADTATYVQRALQRAGGQLLDTVGKVMHAITIDDLEAAKKGIADYLDSVAARGGLSELEIMALGVLYAANETLFPTTALDLIPGGGKALAAVGDAVRAGRGAREVAQITRSESRALADAERAGQINASAAEAGARAEGLNVIRETPGHRGEWNAALNGPLQPNSKYILANGHSYATDELGRVVRAEGTLDANLMRSDRNLYQQLLAGREGGAGYDGGHLIGTLLGGAGEGINLIPQLASINRGQFREFERVWADALLNGKNVRVQVTPVYGNGGSVPTLVEARWWIDGAEDFTSFTNLPGTKP